MTKHAAHPAAPQRLDVTVLRRWAVVARASLAAHRDSIDHLNVFPVPDSDTGTNMFLTLDAAVEATLEPDPTDGAVTAPEPDDPRAELERFARAALLGARGNSGVIVSQLVRGLVEGLQDGEGGAGPRETAAAFEHAARAAYSAVTEPAEGTILTVAERAAAGARRAADDGADLVTVVEAACAAGRSALEATTGQLGVLTRAGVVDAGGAGLLVVLEGLRRVLTGAADPVPAPVGRPVEPPAASCAGADYRGPRHEVMFVVDSGVVAQAEAARAALTRIGEDVLLVGGGRPDDDGRSGPWRGHVHTDDPEAVGPAVARLGTPRDLVVTDLVTGEQRPLAAPTAPEPEGLLLLAAVDGPALARVVVAAGATSVRRSGGIPAVREALSDDRPTVLLAGEDGLLEQARREHASWQAEGLDVLVLDAPTDVHVLAALAVHDPALPDPEARRELTDAVAAVTGVVLGVQDGPDLVAATGAALEQLCAGSEVGLVTAVVGAADPTVGDALVRDLEDVVSARCPGAETSLVDGGDPAYVLALGVER